MSQYVKLGALGQAALEALVAGVAIAIFFALGLRALAMWTGDQVEGDPAAGPRSSAAGAAAIGTRRNPAALVLAIVCFAIVVGIVALGLWVMFTSK